MAVSVSNLAPETALQLPFPLEMGEDGSGLGAPSPERWALDRAVDRVRERFGRQAVGFAGVFLSTWPGCRRRSASWPRAD